MRSSGCRSAKCMHVGRSSPLTCTALPAVCVQPVCKQVMSSVCAYSMHAHAHVRFSICCIGKSELNPRGLYAKSPGAQWSGTRHRHDRPAVLAARRWMQLRRHWPLLPPQQPAHEPPWSRTAACQDLPEALLQRPFQSRPGRCRVAQSWARGETHSASKARRGTRLPRTPAGASHQQWLRS